MRRAVQWVLVGFLVVLAIAGILLALMPWWYDRPRPIPHTTPTTVADLTGDPFVSPSAWGCLKGQTP